MSAFDAVVVGDAEVQQKFDRMPTRLQQELKVGIGRAVLIVERQSKEKKFIDGGNGPSNLLHVRSGRLRRSITSRVTEQAGEVVGTVGTNVEYARQHEFGFHGTVTVREHLRRTKLGNQALVRSHSRKVDLPERSFLRSALRDMKPQIAAEFQGAVHRAIA